LNPQPTATEISRYYPADYGPYQEINEAFKYGFFSKAFSGINKYFRRGGRNPVNKTGSTTEDAAKTYLDFGCGSGRALAALRAEHPNWDLYGLDNNETACARVRKLGIKTFCGDMLKMELPDNFFDIVNLSHVIEHLPDPLAVMLKINKILKKGGTITVTTPDFNSLAAKIFGKFWYALDTPRHLFIFSPLTLSALLEKTGFVVKDIKYKLDPQVAIKSWYFFLNKKDMRLNPITWRLFKFMSGVFSLFYRRASIMTIQAEKKSVS
jgi:SAM-dependent methyltransferase